MKTYLVYNQKTGAVIRTHVVREGHPVSREHVLAMVQREHRQDPLDVAEVTDLSAGECCRVDVQTKTVKRVGRSEVTGFGMGSAQMSRQPPAAKAKKTTYAPAPPKKKKT